MSQFAAHTTIAVFRRLLAFCLLLASCVLPLQAWAVDTDGDGVDDSIDAFPNNAEATTDTDGDGLPDNINLAPLTVFFDAFQSQPAAGWTMVGTWNIPYCCNGAAGTSAAAYFRAPSFLTSIQRSVTLPAAGTVTFYVKGNFSTATLQFSDNGVVKQQWSTLIDWQKASATLAAGTHTLKWSAGNTSGYLDEVRIYTNSSLTEDTDDDNDGVPDATDKFPLDASESIDNDNDGIGDNADTDDDNDGTPDAKDNCPLIANADQLNTDSDAQGNVCDSDDDNDGVADISDKFPLNLAASMDSDSDGFPDTWNASCDATCQAASGLALDNCPANINADQLDTDGDGQGNACDSNDDNDGIDDQDDAFPLDPTESSDNDSDGIGNNLDADDDNDGVLDVADNCPLNANTNQSDDDHDGFGNPCDEDGAGKLDVAFNPGTGAGGSSNYYDYVYAIAQQTDGKVLIGGAFTSYDGTLINRIARLKRDGSLDTSFNQGAGPDSVVVAILLQPDGKVLIAGAFTAVDGVARSGIARLNSNGSLDAGFNPVMGPDISAGSLALQPDGKVLIVQYYNPPNSFGVGSVVRLNSDGSLDAGFNSGAVGISVGSLALQPDGKVLIRGGCNTYPCAPINRIARLNSDGSLDAGFNPAIVMDDDSSDSVGSITLQSDGKMLITGHFTNYNNGNAVYTIARLNSDGSLDNNFNAGTSNNFGYNSVSGTIATVALQADGKVLIAGHFSAYNYVYPACFPCIALESIARLNSDGSLDTNFNPGTGTNDHDIYTLVLQADGKALIGGRFTTYNGAIVNHIARIHTGDADQDGIEDAADYFPNNAAAAADADHDGLPDAWLQPNKFGCAANAPTCNGLVLDMDISTSNIDIDNDGIDNSSDNCPSVSNAAQTDTDHDGIGDACDTTPHGDTDGDGVDNLIDNCPSVSNASQVDTDLDSIGDVCDTTPNGDMDGDGVDNSTDNCPVVANAGQLDTDNDSVGDVCDLYPNDPTLLLQQDGTAKAENLGSSVAMADMNNDGVVDLLIGSPLANVTRSGTVLKKAGQIQIISGKDNSVLRTIDGSAPNQQLGAAIAVVPDQNKDGVPDIIVGDPLADVTQLRYNSFPVLKGAGRVLLYSGSDGRMLRVLAEGNVAGDHFGAAVAVGDVNSDNKPDLIIGASMSDVSAKDAGQVTVFNGLGKTVLYTRNGNQTAEHFGAAVAVANGHLFAGSLQFDTATMKDAGRVSVFNNSEGNSAALLVVEGAAVGDAFGAALTAANDDWAVGIPLADSAGKDAGSVQMFSGLNATPVKTLTGSNAGDNFGSALNMQGDVNKDGKNDIAIGAAKFDASASVNIKTVLLKDAGRVQVLSGILL